MNEIDFVDAVPLNGHLTHAVRYQPEHFYRPASAIVMVNMRAVCGVGVGGMRARLNEDGEIQPYKGIDGCDTCFIRVRDIREASA